jgi:hypothetical protein
MSRPFLVIVRLRGWREIARISVEASTHRQASDAVRESRAWPEGVSFTPRLLAGTYMPPEFVCSDWAMYGTLPALRF